MFDDRKCDGVVVVPSFKSSPTFTNGLLLLYYYSFRFCKKKVCSCVDVRSLCPTAFFNALLLVPINLSLKPAIQGDNFTMNVHLIPSLAIYDVTDSSVMTLFHASSTVVFDNMNCEA